MQLPKPFFGALAGAFISLQLLFLANMCYLYGTAYHDSIRFSMMKLLFIDYDQDVIGQSVMTAYDQLKSPSFPTIQRHSVDEYPTEQDVRNAVCKATAVSSAEAAREYNNSQALTYIWNGAKYSAYAQSVYSMLVQLVHGTAGAYDQMNGTTILSTANVSDPYIAKTVLNPISSSSIDLRPIAQGVRFYYNTVSMVMPILQQFFFLMALNGISAQFNIFSGLSLKQNIALRLAFSICHTFIASLCMSGYTWAFREDWNATSDQFGLTWMAIWLVMHLNFLIIDAATAFIPMQFMSFFMLTWIILNVSSSIGPFELSPGFYWLGYVFPAHELYEILLQIWTDGCNPHLYRALPILWSEWVVALGLSFLGMRKRTKPAVPVQATSQTAKEDMA
ncbi:nitrosoguanidine resistance protein SNG1 [Aspergillus bombycis]|uniref:Nitrosoguanidine resistance protein SNG1 n=1 Tax=Aspergillus bombycis TaxID=109264 RepID=A0A1F7ZZ31_9EURO|nr:nitrosoguanidine resistance protein SNG1 [Aspergillus bombycis]OGM44355.1 nitrosoguanidine resistance protein SNG1 [Aspergillus bombycis]